jgi:hypothetical protein
MAVDIVEVSSTYHTHSNLHLYTGKTMTDLHEEMCATLAYRSMDAMDVVTSVDVQQHNVIGTAESMDWDFDLKDLWLTKSRWTTMIRQYINPIALETWLNACEAKLHGRKRGVSIMRTNEVKQRTSPKKNADTGTRIWRTWGSCMLAIGYRALPYPQITLHSRTSYLGYIGALDLSVAYACASAIAERVGLDVRDIQFVWHLEAAQFHAFKSMAYLLNDDYRREQFMDITVGNGTSTYDKRLRRDCPSLYIARKWMNGFQREDAEGLKYGDMNFGQTRRIRKRYHTEVLGYEYGEPYEGGGHRSESQNKRFKPLPSCPAKLLTFDQLFSSSARRSNTISWGEENAGKVDTTDEQTDDLLAAASE